VAVTGIRSSITASCGPLSGCKSSTAAVIWRHAAAPLTSPAPAKTAGQAAAHRAIEQDEEQSRKALLLVREVPMGGLLKPARYHRARAGAFRSRAREVIIRERYLRPSTQ